MRVPWPGYMTPRQKESEAAFLKGKPCPSCKQEAMKCRCNEAERMREILEGKE